METSHQRLLRLLDVSPHELTREELSGLVRKARKKVRHKINRKDAMESTTRALAPIATRRAVWRAKTELQVMRGKVLHEQKRRCWAASKDTKWTWRFISGWKKYWERMEESFQASKLQLEIEGRKLDEEEAIVNGNLCVDDDGRISKCIAANDDKVDSAADPSLDWAFGLSSMIFAVMWRYWKSSLQRNPT